MTDEEDESQDKDKNNIIKFILKRFQNNKTIAEKSV